MVFQQAFDSFKPLEQAALSARLLTLASNSRIWRQVEQNLWNEHRLPVDAAKHLLGRLLAVANEPNKLKSAYVDACRDLILKGFPVNISRPIVLGRAVTRDTFLRNLVREGFFSSIGQARSWLRSMLTLDPNGA